MNAHEEWREVEGYPYEVSSLGRVRRGGRVLAPRRHSHGYHRVCFSVGGVSTDAYIHRLVCEAFHGPPPYPDHHADHIDGTRDNNHASNLRWLSPSENRKLRNIAKGERSGQSKLKEAEVRMILRVSTNTSTDKSLAAKFNVSREQVRDIRLRKSWRHIV